MSDSHPPIHVTDAQGLSRNTNSALVVLTVPRSHIVACNIAGVLEVLHTLADTPESTRLYRDALHLQVQGYGDDPRELCEIPQVRQYFSLLAQHWPHWLWFLARGHQQVPLLLSLLCECSVRRDAGNISLHFGDAGQVQRCLSALTQRSNAMFCTHGIGLGDALQSLQSAMRELSSTP